MLKLILIQQMILFLLQIQVSQQLDTCKEYNNIQNCIESKGTFCFWNSQTDTCSTSENYLMGCSPYINEQGCILQLGYGLTETAKCKFDKVCHSIYDPQNEECSAQLSKYACLGITNIYQICKWVNNLCYSVTGDDILKIQNSFQTILYSASACRHINNYLIIHSTIIWNLLEYEPDLLEQSDQQILNQLVDQPQNLEELSNSYLTNGNFLYFDQSIAYNSTINRYRLGCNAIDIIDSDDFNQLIILSNNVGINHIYCKYIEQINNQQIQIAFINGKCVQIDRLQLMQRQISINVECKDISFLLCPIYTERVCYIPNNISNSQFTCLPGEQIAENSECEGENTVSYYICKQKAYCYFNQSFLTCSQNCVNYQTKNDCQNNQTCKWASDFDSSADNIKFCLPSYGCDHLGVDQLYCKYMYDTCDWVENNCIKVNDSEAYTCEQSFNKYVCLNVKKSDQQCLWYNEQCINVLDYEESTNYDTYPQDYSMNRNLCVNFIGDNFIYNIQTHKCTLSELLLDCNNQLINKEHCYNISNDLCQWDDYYNQCQQIQNIGNCNQLINVSFKVCKYGINSNDNMKCIYNFNTHSCYEVSILTEVDTPLLEDDCYNIETQNYYRQWQNGQCVILTYEQVNEIQCISWRNINRNVCVSNIYNSQACAYDTNNKVCYNDVPLSDCSQNYNQFACQQSSGQCYFDLLNNVCQNAESQMFSKLDCETFYVSKLTCLQLSSYKCLWDHYTLQCRSSQDELFQFCNQTKVNQLTCISYQAATNIQYHQYQYCLYNTTTYDCNITYSNISGCGTSQPINYHTCANYTSSSCAFFNTKCIELFNTTRLDQLYLQNLTCASANQNTCPMILSRNQGCRYQYFTKFDYIDARCYNLDFGINKCADFKTSNSTYNRVICSKVTDSCQYNFTSKACASTGTSTLFPCVGNYLSSTACLTYTYGKCLFTDYCSGTANNIDVACSSRNMQSCISSNKLKCSFSTDTKLCTTSTYDCQTRVVGNTYASWSTCSMSNQQCYGGRNGCIIGYMNNIPCDTPGLSQSVCINQSKLFCEFLNGYCQFVISQPCNQINDKEKCLNNKYSGEYCVYQNGICFSDSSLSKSCDFYALSSYNYCRRFDNCYYDFNNYTCISGTNTFNNCLENNNQNIYLINQTCDFYINTDVIPTCLSDLLNQQMNYNLCQLINDNDLNNSCFYQWNSHLCKLSTYQSALSCESISNAQECIFTNIICYAWYSSTTFIQCSSQISSTYTNKINRYGCTQKTDSTYIFVYDDWVCNSITKTSTTSLQQLLYSNQLNKNSCIIISSIYGQFYYMWKDNNCIEISQKQASQLTDCTNLNQQACLSTVTVTCAWDTINSNCIQDEKLTYVDCQSQTISSINYLYSQGHCAKTTKQSCIQNSSNNGCELLSTDTTKSIFRCRDQGLNRLACLNETKLTFCVWNSGFCDDYNKYIQKCDDDVSQWTCNQMSNCVWISNKCSTFIIDYSVCQNSNNYQTYCLQNEQKQCYYIQQLGQCLEFSFIPTSCNWMMSKLGCRNVQGETCIWENNQCAIANSISNCEQIYNQESCLNNENIGCIWNNECITYYVNEKIEFQLLPQKINKYACLTYSLEPTDYQDSVCINKMNYSQMQNYQYLSLVVKKSEQKCEDCLTQEQCTNIKSSNIFCIWKNQCQSINDFSTLLCESNLNIWSCLSIITQGQYCKWSNNKCLNFQEQDTSFINININVCIKYTEGKIYSKNSCISTTESLTCASLGISKQTCVTNQELACQWINSCVNFSIPTTLNNCNEVYDVSQKSCQLLSLACQYDNNANTCISYQKGGQLGLSKKACLSQQGYYYWWSITNNCMIATSNDIFSCDDQLQVTNEICTLIQDSLCRYDTTSQTCISKYNPEELKCTTLGLNKLGCLAVKYEACIFTDYCQQIVDFNQSYITLQNINQFTCIALYNNQLKYNSIKNICELANNVSYCKGLNKNACLIHDYCYWNNDFSDCSCLFNSELCYNKQKEECISEECIYQQNTCMRKQCKHLEINECQGKVINNLTCYLKSNNECGQAKQCNDIIDAQNCNNIFINGIQCMTNKLNPYYCYNDLITFCNQSTDCINEKCIQRSNGICEIKTCLDYDQDQCNFIDSCAYINESCIAINSCMDIVNPDICNQVTYNNQKCNWQLQNLYDDKQICTNQPCLFYGLSYTLCQGNEYNNYACIIDHFKCINCESISESCFCTKQHGICNYVSGKCQSILCYQLNQAQCLNSIKCEWSDQLEQCSRQCRHYSTQEECNLRNSECYWENAKTLCLSGQKALPTLYVPITQQNYIIIFGINILILLI